MTPTAPSSIGPVFEQLSGQDPWKHRSSAMTCKTCMWYMKKVSSDPISVEIGRCRRHAPTMGGFPVVFPADWCGDHRLNENAVRATD